MKVCYWPYAVYYNTKAPKALLTLDYMLLDLVSLRASLRASAACPPPARFALRSKAGGMPPCLFGRILEVWKNSAPSGLCPFGTSPEGMTFLQRRTGVADSPHDSKGKLSISDLSDDSKRLNPPSRSASEGLNALSRLFKCCNRPALNDIKFSFRVGPFDIARKSIMLFNLPADFCQSEDLFA